MTPYRQHGIGSRSWVAESLGCSCEKESVKRVSLDELQWIWKMG